jgi:hypothetical protein
VEIAAAQTEVRTVYQGGFTGLLVSGILWGVSAALGAWVAPRPAILVLIVGGMFIHPLSQVLLRLMGGPWSIRAENPLRHLAMQAAFIIPLTLPVVAGAALYKLNWFYPALMVVVGAHYLPFVFLYGMWQYACLGAILIVLGLATGILLPGSFSLGAWLAAAIFLGAALPFRRIARRPGETGTPPCS